MAGDQCLPVYRHRIGGLPRISAGDTVQKTLYVGKSSAISNKVESLGSALMHLWAEPAACRSDCAKPHERNEIAGESGGIGRTDKRS
ncbi:hypothetical protein ACVIHH_008151 [Bradyrhizobium sp. USDA 4518]|uniref:hypothetical protein n=1 Tax=unclassified Bradyrhizobium TaxID=2631580 RepID=UPI00209CD5D5|nr:MULTISPECIES: hypothetical protein [unclassified Bradyrhizobium]MCP1835753.1 hypothetical protein [Bradyrhizobium sp. USDA 4545]MCP1920502.1 hypothetical protein [Bradyrhizobium sp. USDA 4532]